MKIVVNTRVFRKGHIDGIGWFTYNTMRYIVQHNPGIEFHFLFDSEIDPQFLFADNIVPHMLFPPAKHALLNIITFEWSVKRVLKKVQPDLFLSPDGLLCLGWGGKQYGVIHDINFVHIPEDLKWTNRVYYNYFFPRFARKAVGLATVSAYSKNDIVSTFGIPESKIDIVYSGINAFYAPVSDEVKKETKQKYTGGADYFIFVGSLHPRKNILRLMQAFALFKERTGSDMKLLLVGKEMYKTGEMHACRDSLPCKDDILFPGYLPDAELKKLYASALCLSFVPYFEGFGLPPVEAMQCDVPVIASNVTSIPEVVGDAGLLVDPYDVGAIASAMERIYREPSLRAGLVAKGRIRRDQFPWDRTAELLWQSVRKYL